MRINSLYRLLRVHQWSKNTLVFLAGIASHRIFSEPVFINSTLDFCGFCCCASAAYITNDIIDSQVDREHATKRKRPIASAEVSVKDGLIAAVALLLLSGLFTYRLPKPAIWITIIYFAGTVVYSLFLKRLVLIDAFMLAFLYLLRVAGGSAATNIRLSRWTVMFTLCAFFSLALLKRYTELRNSDVIHPGQSLPGRGYARSDLNFVSQSGIASGLLSVFVLATHIGGPDIQILYKRQDILWLLVPLFGFAMLSMWLAGHRGEMHEDPIIFAARHPVTYVLGLLAALVMLAASR